MRKFRYSILEGFRRTVYWLLSHPIVSFIAFAVTWSALYFAVVRGVDLGDDVRRYWDSIFGGVLASVATYSLTRAYYLQRRGLGIKEWLMFGPSRIWIIPSYLEHPSTRILNTPYYTVPPFDAQATGLLVEITRDAGYSYPFRSLIGSHRFREDVLVGNVITFCLPERNQYSRIFLGIFYEIYCKKNAVKPKPKSDDPLVSSFLNDDRLKKPYYCLQQIWRLSGEDKYLEWMIKDFSMPAGEDWRRSTINMRPEENVHFPGAENTDYCLIVKAPNPFNSQATVIVICGIHGIGSLAGSLWLKENRHELYRKYPTRETAILLQVNYVTPDGVDNYIDSTIARPINFKSAVSNLAESCSQ